MERNRGFCRTLQSRMGHENSESLFDRLFDWNCCWVGAMDVRPRANHLARSSQMASFLLTLVTTIVIQVSWPRLTETNSQ